MPFGYHVRELACHHMMAYHGRLAAAADGDPRAEEALRAHCRRAVLELVLRRKGCATMPLGLEPRELAGLARDNSPRATALHRNQTGPYSHGPYSHGPYSHARASPRTGRAAALASSRTAPRPPSNPDHDPDPDH